MYALIDCNNFYVSCERVFQPELIGKAGVVLSNNDGCAIARSQEAKDMGIKMGAPFFEIRELVEAGKLWWRSSNYPLYQNMMRRVTGIIMNQWPEMEIYSIDECFCDVSMYGRFDLEEMGLALKKRIYQYTGIPVCVGIAPTLTLAKLANRIAKKNKDYGVHLLDDGLKVGQALRATLIEDVWGIGRQHGTRLIKMKVLSAYDFIGLPQDWVQKTMTIQGLRMWKELKGIPCREMEYDTPLKKGISTARSFGGFEKEIEPMEAALATYVANAALKLRNQNSVCANIYVFAHTSRFAQEAKNYSNGITIKLQTPTNFTNELLKFALEG
ncbi:MAG: Y-family DNA polymerase, partial [Hymenobacter sp.]